MARNADTDPVELAKNIQKNVEILLVHSNDLAAKDALQKDAFDLSAKGIISSGGKLEDDKFKLQESVQAQLDKLEASGTIPIVTICADGEITGTKVLPGTHKVIVPGVGATTESNFEEVIADSNQSRVILQRSDNDNSVQN